MKKQDFAIIYVILGFIMFMSSLYYIEHGFLQGFVLVIGTGFLLLALVYSFAEKGEKPSEKSVQ